MQEAVEDMKFTKNWTESSPAPVPEATPQAPEEQDRHLCQACQGSGQCSEDMNRAVRTILEAQAEALAEASLVSAVKGEKEGGESPASDDDKRQGDFTTMNLGMTSVDLIVIVFFSWMLHGSTKVVVRAVALLSANTRINRMSLSKVVYVSESNN